jgi:effector-binding domain-containing protein
VPYRVEVKTVEAYPIAVVRRRASIRELARVVPEACGEVWKFVRIAQMASAGRNIAVYLDDEINLEVGVEVPVSFIGDGNVICSATPAGTVATTAHWGPYDRLGDAHAAIRKWFSEHQREAAGPNWEIYGHWNDDPSQLRTDVFYLVARDEQPPR